MASKSKKLYVSVREFNSINFFLGIIAIGFSLLAFAASVKLSYEPLGSLIAASSVILFVLSMCSLIVGGLLLSDSFTEAKHYVEEE